MEMTDRPHRCSSTTNNNASATGGELFICFTSRLSSSMKLPSKSILSPARTAATRDSSQISLSSSLSRRLRPSGSLRAGQASPMFPPTSTAGKKRGCGFDNPEPTSPKVTCIGQVRVKTKGKKIRPRSKPRPAEVSFRKIDPNNLDMAHLHHQECRKWVHLPVTICEALRAIGTEFNCFLPCRSSCMANHRDKQEKASSDAGSGGGNGGGGGSSCGAVLARWLVAAVQEGEGEGRGRQIELVVGEEEEEEEDIIRSSHRRHVFEDIEINLCDNEMEKEQGRVSICIPPKNALLLMRCRSDPVKMAALASRSWEPPLPKREHCVMEEDEEEEEDGKAAHLIKREKQEPEIEERECKELSSSCEKLLPLEAVEQLNLNQKDVEPESTLDKEQDEDFLQGLENPQPEGNRLEDETTAHESAAEAAGQDVEITAAGESFSAQGMQHESPAECAPFVEAAEEFEADVSDSVQENGSDQVEVEQTAEPEPEPEPESASAPHSDDNLEETIRKEEFVEAENEEASSASDVREETEEAEAGTKENGRPKPPDPEENGSKREEKLLPDCLLLMMCEPKLSMEVSKETWVCSRDFIRWQPEKQRAVKVKRKDGPDEDESKRRISVDRKPVLVQPPRSSVSFPVAAAVGAGGGGSIARMIEQKLVGGGKGCDCEPFVLTRCKSEPMRSAAKLAPDSCLWKSRKVEPPATLGVGAAGVGF